MMAADETRLNGWETQCAIAHVLKKAISQEAAERGAVAAAISIVIRTRGPSNAVNYLRDLADVIERDVVLPPGQGLQ